MENNIIEGNVIATFMGAKYDGRKYWTFPDGSVYMHSQEYGSHFKYHSSWDRLMPVWVKWWKDAGSYEFKSDELVNKVMAIHSNFHLALDDGDCIKAANILANAIEWYKEQNAVLSDTTEAK